jgi:hypothetical protein
MKTAERYLQRVVIPAIEANDAARTKLLAALQKYIAETPLEAQIHPHFYATAKYLMEGNREYHKFGQRLGKAWDPLTQPLFSAAMLEERAFERMAVLPKCS